MAEKLTTEERQNEILQKVIKFRSDAVAGSGNLFDRMDKADRFRKGDQWDPADEDALDADNKFHLTIPLIKPKVNHICGTQIQNPKDFKVRGLRGGTDSVAKVLTALAKHAMDSEHARYEKSQFFESGTSVGAGYFGAFIDKNTDPKHANLIIEKLDEFECIVDPNCKVYDINASRSGAKYFIWEPWEDKELLEAEYPDKAEELKAMGGRGGIIGAAAGATSWIIDMMLGRWSNRNVSNFGPRAPEDSRSLTKHRYKKSHTWWREAKRCVLWYDEQKSELDAILLVKDGDIKAAKDATKAQPDRFSVEEVVRSIVHHTIHCGSVFLEDREDELNGVELIPISRYSADHTNGHLMGIVEDMIGTQEEINWSHSQSLNIIKKTANTGYIIKRDKTGTYKTWLEDHGHENGIVLVEEDAGGEIKQIEPSRFPVAFELIHKEAKENLNQISNIRTEDPTGHTDESGRAIALKQHGSQTGSMPLLSNFDYSMSLFGDILIEILRRNDIYSEDEIMEVVDKEDLIDEAMLNQARQIIISEQAALGLEIPEQPPSPQGLPLDNADPMIQQVVLQQYEAESQAYARFMELVDQKAVPMAMQMLMAEIKNWGRGKYSTKVTLSTAAPTFRLMKSAELFELNAALIESQQVPIDRESLIESTDVDNKDELIERGKQMQQQMAGASK